MNDRLDYLQDLVNGLGEIPASEPFIGHLQMAVKDALGTITDELKYLRKQADDFREWRDGQAAAPSSLGTEKK